MIEKYGTDYSTIEPTKEQLKILKGKKKPENMKEANEMIDELVKEGKINDDEDKSRRT